MLFFHWACKQLCTMTQISGLRIHAVCLWLNSSYTETRTHSWYPNPDHSSVHSTTAVVFDSSATKRNLFSVLKGTLETANNLFLYSFPQFSLKWMLGNLWKPGVTEWKTLLKWGKDPVIAELCPFGAAVICMYKIVDKYHLESPVSLTFPGRLPGDFMIHWLFSSKGSGEYTRCTFILSPVFIR